MATSPAPDAAAPPGMCPGIAVLGGGGGGGGADGSGDGGDDGAGGGGSGSGAGGNGGGKNAKGPPDYAKYPECGYASHPVDVVTGRAFTHPILDLELPGPLPLVFQRMYSSSMAERDVGLGHGWGHTFGWEIEVQRRTILVWSEQGVAVEFPMIRPGDEVVGPWGWLLRRDAVGFTLDADDGVWRRFTADEGREKRHRLSSVEDLNGNRISLTYDKGCLVEVIDSAGRLIRIDSTREGRIASVKVKNALAQGQWVAFATYTYDDRGDLVAVMDADGFSWRYAYDDEHRLTADADRAGLTFHFVYDREGRCVEAWGDYPGKVDPSLTEAAPARLSDGTTRRRGIHHCRFDYMPNGYTEVTDSTQVRRFFGNKHGTLDKRVDGDGVMTAVYRDDGHLVARMDETGGVTSYERDARGRVLQVTDPIGRVTSFTRDANGLPTAITDAAGGVTRVERDERGRVVQAVSPTAARRWYAYDDQGNAIAITEPNGGVRKITYDALGRVIARTDPLGVETHFTYSARGDLLSVRDAYGLTRYAYDGERRLIQVVDALGRVTELVWGGYNKLCARKDANGNEVRLRYNVEGELVEVHNERGEIHRLTYDASGVLKREITFDGRTLSYRHDPAARLTHAINGLGEVTEFVYDLAGQVVKKLLDDGSVEEFSYDARGDLVAAKGPSGDLRFERDPVGRILREAQIVGGVEHVVDSSYDASGARVGRATSLGHTEVVVRGALGERARTVLNGRAVEHRSDMLGREIARALPGGGWIQSAYNELGRLERRRAGGAAPLDRWAARSSEPDWIGTRADGATVDTAYRYDLNGELIESSDRRRGHTQLAYDPVGQLLAMVPEKARAEIFRYDPAGNVYEDGPNAEERVYGKGNRLLRKGDTEYRWDDDGRLIEQRTRERESGEDRIWRYSWNGAGMMSSAEGPDGTRVEFTYDPFARRVQKRVSKPDAPFAARELVSTTRFVWDGNVLVHEIREEAEAQGDPVVLERTYCFDDFTPLAQHDKRTDVAGEQSAWSHYVNDPSGAPDRLLADDGSVACELDRRAWGDAELIGEARTTTPLRLQGQYADEETGLTYNRFRYLFAGGDVFCGPDPLGLIAGTHFYRSVWNPFSWIDPFGLASMRDAENLLNESEGRRFGPSNEGHADWHVPPPGANTAAAHAAARGNSKNTTFRNRNQAIRALRECMNKEQAALAALRPSVPGESNPPTVGGTLRLPQTLEGEFSANGGTATRVNVDEVSYRFGRMPNGDLHLLHFQPEIKK